MICISFDFHILNRPNWKEGLLDPMAMPTHKQLNHASYISWLEIELV